MISFFAYFATHKNNIFLLKLCVEVYVLIKCAHWMTNLTAVVECTTLYYKYYLCKVIHFRLGMGVCRLHYRKGTNWARASLHCIEAHAGALSLSPSCRRLHSYKCQWVKVFLLLWLTMYILFRVFYFNVYRFTIR